MEAAGKYSRLKRAVSMTHANAKLHEAGDARAEDRLASVMGPGRSRHTHRAGPPRRDSSCPQTQAEKLGVDVSGATIVDPETAPELERYVDDLVEARKKKVLTLQTLLTHPHACVMHCPCM